MREAQFLKQNIERWKKYENEIKAGQKADVLAERFIELTDDLAYGRTFYPGSNTSRYLNGLTSLFYHHIYKNKKEKSSRIWSFWQYELPYLFRQYHKQFAWALVFFLVFCSMGVLSARYDKDFTRFILGDRYINMTNEFIKKGDPFAVYRQSGQMNMFVSIAFNNIRVAFVTYVFGIFLSVGTIIPLLQNGLMLGSFEYYFFSKGLGFKSITVVFIHGTLEIWSIVIAGAAGLILGNSLLFPGTYNRLTSVLKGGKDGLKIVVGLIPIFITAAFFEGFVTRYSNMPLWISLTILTASVGFIIWYFVIYPLRLHKRIQAALEENTPDHKSQNFTKWLSKKLSLERLETLVAT